MATRIDRAKELVADYTNKEQQRLEAIRKHEEELAEQERQRQARILAEQQAQQKTQELNEGFNEANRLYENPSQFSDHELVASNSVTVVGNALDSAFSGADPRFLNVKLDWIRSHLFMLRARQYAGIGYRDCLIMGSQVRDNEVQIRFKVFEYDHPPTVKLLGGALTINLNVKTTVQDPQAAAAQAERFQQQIKDGINEVTALIQKTIGQ